MEVENVAPPHINDSADEEDAPPMSGVGVAAGSEEEVATVVNEAVVNKIVAEKKRNRGRPRKYANLSTIGSKPVSFHPGSQETQRRKACGKLKITPSIGRYARDSGEESFTPYVENVVAGEDIVSKIILLSLNTRKAICVLSATGPVSRALFGTPLAGLLQYEGICEILSLSGSCIYHDTKWGNVPSVMENCRLSVALAQPNGQVFGGSLASLGGSLIAAGPVQLIVASFKQNGTTGGSGSGSGSGSGNYLKRKYFAESSSADGGWSQLRVSKIPSRIVRGMVEKEDEHLKSTPTISVPSAQLQRTSSNAVRFENHHNFNPDPPTLHPHPSTDPNMIF